MRFACWITTATQTQNVLFCCSTATIVRWISLKVTFTPTLPVLFLIRVYLILSALRRNQLHEWSVFGSVIWWWTELCSLLTQNLEVHLYFDPIDNASYSLREERQKGEFVSVCLVLKPRQLNFYFDASDKNLFVVFSQGKYFFSLDCKNKLFF
jgi:hypothetical protein